jgi:hypothetical protein
MKRLTFILPVGVVMVASGLAFSDGYGGNLILPILLIVAFVTGVWMLSRGRHISDD